MSSLLPINSAGVQRSVMIPTPTALQPLAPHTDVVGKIVYLHQHRRFRERASRTARPGHPHPLGNHRPERSTDHSVSGELLRLPKPSTPAP